MRGRIFLAVISLFLILVLTATQAWAIFNCYDYVFWRLTGLDAMPPDPASLDPRVRDYGPACVFDRSKIDSINGFACIEAVLNKRGNYTALPTDTTKTPVPRLAPGDVIYIPKKHVVYSEGFNYDRDPNLYDADPNRDIKPRDYPILSHYFEIPQTYYQDRSMEVIHAEHLSRYRYGYMGGERKGVIGGYSERDTFRQMLEKDRSPDTGYIVYKKHRLDVIIEVRDGSGKPIRDALIDLDGKTYRAGDKGRIMVELDPDRHRDKDLPFAVRKPGFKDEKRSLMAFQMKPSADFIVYPVDLEPVDLTEMMNKLDYELAEKRSRLDSACLELIKLNEERIKAVGGIKAPTGPDRGPMSNFERWMESQENLYKSASRDCGGLKRQRQTLKTLVTAVERDLARIETQMRQAEGVKCGSKAELARLESLDRKIVGTAWDIYNGQYLAYRVRYSITQTLWDADNLYTNSLQMDPFLTLAMPELTAPEDRLKWMQRFRDERFTPAYLKVQQVRSECVKAHDEAAARVSSSQAGLAKRPPAGGPPVLDARADEFSKSAKNMAPRPGQPCDEELIKREIDYALKQYTDLVAYMTPHRARVAKLKAACATTAADLDLFDRLMKSYKSLSDYYDRRNKLLKVIADCRTALSKTSSPTGTPPKATPPSVHVNLLIEGPTEAFVGDRMDFKAVILDKQFASDILRPEGAYAMYWYVDGKRRGDLQYYSDTVNFHAATVGTHTLRVDFVWGSPKTGKVTLLGSKTIKVVIKKKESQDYANVSVPHGKWVPTGLSVKKGDVIEIEAKGAYTTKDGGKIGPEGGGHWGWWTLAVRYGKTVHLPGRGNTYYAEESGDLELGTPRGAGSNTFLPEDIANLQGALTVRVTVKRKTP